MAWRNTNLAVQSVFSETVRSWYKPYGPDGRVVGIWPGPFPACVDDVVTDTRGSKARRCIITAL